MSCYRSRRIDSLKGRILQVETKRLHCEIVCFLLLLLSLHKKLRHRQARLYT